MYVKEIYDKVNKSNVIGYRLYISVKDNKLKKYTNKEKTFLIPENIKSSREKQKFLAECKVNWQNEVDLMVKGLVNLDKNKIRFVDFAKLWVDELLINNKEGIVHYRKCLDQLKIFEEQFGNYTLEDMNISVVQGFCNWLQTRFYYKEKVVVSKSLIEIVKQNKLTYKKICDETGLSSTTLKVLFSVGQTVSYESSKIISDYLMVKYEDYFNRTRVKTYYSKSSNQGLRIMLHSVLQDAVRKGLISVNYASKEFVKPIKGKSKEKSIYNSMSEISEFIGYVNKESDLRKKCAFLIMIELGLRSCEVAGLEWSDFDLINNTLEIKRDCLYVRGYGIITKSTKTESSHRVISLPENLVMVLKEYRVKWLKEKLNHGDLWLKTDRLFVQNNGNNMANSTISVWLKKFQEKNNLKRVTSHGLRHTNITMLISNNIDMKTVSARVGHCDIHTTLNIYTHYCKESDLKASQFMDNILNKKEEVLYSS